MLVLQRYIGQSIQIGDQIKISFLKQENGRMKVGIEAPKDVLILRTEIIGKPLKKRKHPINSSE